MLHLVTKTVLNEIQAAACVPGFISTFRITKFSAKALLSYHKQSLKRPVINKAYG
jgi:hypothetical protein